MDLKKKTRLRARGWAVGSTEEFLDLTAVEERYIALKLALAASLKSERLKNGVTQIELAELMGSSQSRVAKMEAGDPSVSIDLLLRGLLSLGVSNGRLSKMIR